MRKFNCAIIALGIAIACNAQITFPQPGLVQGILHHGNIYEPGFTNRSIKYEGDTFMCGYSYSKIYEYSSYLNEYEPYYSVRDDNGRIYGRWSCSYQEYLLYDFSAVVGDTINIENPGVFADRYRVDSVYLKTVLNGTQRQYLFLHGAASYNHNVILRWIEGIGDIDRGFFYEADFEGGGNSFICHKENGELIWANPNYNTDCDSLTFTSSVSIEEAEESKPIFSVYPTLTNEAVTIKILSGVKTFAEMRELSGKCILRKTLTANNSSILLTNFPKGMYLLILSAGDYFQTFKIIRE